MGQLSDGLTRLLVTGARVDRVDLPIALQAHTATFALLVDVHTGLTQSTFHGRPPQVSELEHHPVAVLGHLLQAAGRVADAAPTDTLLATPATASGRAWLAVGAAAIRARVEWNDARPETLPDGDTAWSEVADLAALTRAATHASADLAGSARAAGNPDIADTLDRIVASGLNVTADQVLALAAAGPLPEAEDLARRRPAMPVAIPNSQAIPEGLARLSLLLDAAERLSPKDAELITQALAHTGQQTLRVLAEAGADPAVSKLVRAVDALNRARGGAGAITVLEACDPRPLVQAHQINQHLAELTRRRGSLDAATVLAMAERLPQAVTRLHEATRRQIDIQNWWTPQTIHHRGTAHTAWAPATIHDDELRLPALLSYARHTLNALPEHLDPLRVRVMQSAPARAHPTSGLTRPPRITLTQALAGLPTAARPAHPRLSPTAPLGSPTPPRRGRPRY